MGSKQIHLLNESESALLRGSKICALLSIALFCGATVAGRTGTLVPITVVAMVGTSYLCWQGGATLLLYLRWKHRENAARDARAFQFAGVLLLIPVLCGSYAIISVPARGNPIATILLLLFAQAPFFIFSVVLWRRQSSGNDFDSQASRSVVPESMRAMIWWLPSIVILIQTYRWDEQGGGWTSSEIGLPFNENTLLAIAVGSGCAAPWLFWAGRTLLNSRRSAKRVVVDENVTANIREVDLKVAGNLIALLVLGPIVEELVYRGIFVIYTWRATANLPFAISLGVVLTVALHLYHGTNGWWLVVCFAAIAVALALSPMGIVGAIVFHSWCNLSVIVIRATSGQLSAE